MFENAPPLEVYSGEIMPEGEQAEHDSGELIPPEVLEDIRLSHNIAWHIGELGIGVERLDPSTLDYIGPAHSTILRFASPRDRRVFLEEVMDEFTTRGDDAALDLFPVDKDKNIWQLMVYGCEPEFRSSTGSETEMKELNREVKKELDAFLHRRVQDGWEPEYSSSLPPTKTKVQLMAEYLLSKTDKRYF